MGKPRSIGPEEGKTVLRLAKAGKSHASIRDELVRLHGRVVDARTIGRHLRACGFVSAKQGAATKLEPAVPSSPLTDERTIIEETIASLRLDLQRPQPGADRARIAGAIVACTKRRSELDRAAERERDASADAAVVLTRLRRWESQRRATEKRRLEALTPADRAAVERWLASDGAGLVIVDDAAEGGACAAG